MLLVGLVPILPLSLTYARRACIRKAQAYVEQQSRPTATTTELGRLIAQEARTHPQAPQLTAALLQQAQSLMDYEVNQRVLGHERVPTAAEVIKVQQRNHWAKPRGDCKSAAVFTWSVARAAGLEARVVFDHAYGHAWTDIRTAGGRWVSINGRLYGLGQADYAQSLPRLSRWWVELTDALSPSLREYTPTDAPLVPHWYREELHRRGEDYGLAVRLGIYQPEGKRLPAISVFVSAR